MLRECAASLTTSATSSLTRGVSADRSSVGMSGGDEYAGCGKPCEDDEDREDDEDGISGLLEVMSQFSPHAVSLALSYPSLTAFRHVVRRDASLAR